MRATFLQTSMSVWDADDIWSLLKTKQTKKKTQNIHQKPWLITTDLKHRRKRGWMSYSGQAS